MRSATSGERGGRRCRREAGLRGAKAVQQDFASRTGQSKARLLRPMVQSAAETTNGTGQDKGPFVSPRPSQRAAAAAACRNQLSMHQSPTRGDRAKWTAAEARVRRISQSAIERLIVY